MKSLVADAHRPVSVMDGSWNDGRLSTHKKGIASSCARMIHKAQVVLLEVGI